MKKVTQPLFNDILWNMCLAIEQADLAYSKGEVPVGAICVAEDGKTLSVAHNLKESTPNPCGHAEILALTNAAKSLGEWRLLNATLYVTLEPCPMCLDAARQARIKNVIFGAYDKKGGAISLGYNFHKDTRLNHHFNIMGGIFHYKCSSILSTFFKQRRNSYKNANTFKNN
jgi:tRNA(adenine34) deaminase